MKYCKFNFTPSFQCCLTALLLIVLNTHAIAQKHRWYIKVGKNGTIGFVNPKDFPVIDERLTGIQKAVVEILDNFKVPGASITVVEKGKVVYTNGLGYRDLQNKMPVTENTLFPIGSCTKAFTAALMGTLLDEKKVDFDQPANNYLPELQFVKPELTRQVTLRDMMAQRTGLPRHDMAWYLFGNATNRAGLLRAIRYLEPNTGLRETWGYNNFMYLAQGALAEQLTGKTWEQVLSERLLLPLGMGKAVLSTPDLINAPDHALGYAFNAKEQTIQQMDYYFFNGMEPAGSISASSLDMAQWLKLWIHGGQWAGKAVFSNNYYQQAIKTQMAMPAAGDRPDLNSFVYGYGLGWMIKGYKGHYFVEHGGNINGFSATTGFFPCDSIGIYVCVNQNNSLAQLAIRNWIADRMLGAKKTDWVKDLLPKAAETPVKQEIDLGQVHGTQPSHALADFAGVYLNKGYGSIQLFLSGNQLMAVLGADTATVEHYHYDIFKINLHLGGGADSDEVKIGFHTGYDGAVDALDGQFEPSIMGGTRFSKQLPKVGEPTPTDLNKYEGRYTLSGMSIKVYVQNNSLRMLVPGQPEYELAVNKPDEFKITIAEGYFVRFEIKDGKAIAAFLIQPDGTYKMMRE